MTRHVHYAPYLDYRPLGENDPDVASILDRPECAWIDGELEKKAAGHAVANVVPEHLAEIRTARSALIAKTESAVKDRLTKEINYWDHRAEELKLQEQAGKTGARLNSGEARKRADMLQARLRKRLEELKLEAQISPLPPVVLGEIAGRPQRTHRYNGRTEIDGFENGRQYAGIRRPSTQHHHGDRIEPWPLIRRGSHRGMEGYTLAEELHDGLDVCMDGEPVDVEGILDRLGVDVVEASLSDGPKESTSRPCLRR